MTMKKKLALLAFAAALIGGTACVTAEPGLYPEPVICTVIESNLHCLGEPRDGS
jgi:hypothetical protein